MDKANTKTNFNMSAQGGFSTGIYNGSMTVGFDRSAESGSEGTKKDFHEAVMKASEEYKDERNLEVNTSMSRDTEGEESGEISNPNDEIPVTFLFYELQRRYRVFEKIHRATPVVLVAQEVPAPGDIDEDWLVANDWILKRVMLDDTLLPALAYLSTRMPGDEVSLQETKKNIDLQRRLVEKLKTDVVAIQAYVGRRYATLEAAMERQAKVAGSSGGGGGGLLGDLLGGAAGAVEDFLLGGGGDPAQAARLREQAAQDAFDKASKEEQQARGKLEREVTALNDLSASYTKALAEHLNRKAQVMRLRVHVKQNILYYMQAIWSHEPPDQRYFRLHKVKVPTFAPAAPATYTMVRRTDWAGGVPDEATAAHTFEFTPNAPLAEDFSTEDKFTTLDQVADLDGLLGYKGNYMIFPLKASNPLTDLMIAPYVDAAVELHDPDEAGNWTLDEFSAYVCRLQETLTPEQFAARKDVLKAQYAALLMKPLRNGEEIIVPTGSLFIEALPGAHPILEDFKLMHRAIDVKKAQAELRKAELENVRLAARLLGNELEDPDIEKKILIQGDPGVTVPVSDN
jgi:hypothetical protein